MTIYRGPGGAVETTDSATVNTVTTKAAEAATSATNAASSATSAANSASSATNSASTATSQASSASTSATQAASSASAASTSASNASTSETNAATSATTASSSATAATTARTAAEAAQVAAETAETNAAASESTASTAATTATTKASEASTSATTASTAATTASTAATAAETARDQTLASFDSFDDRYLGSKTADPTLDNDGDALVGGALYFNSVDEVMKVYTGSQWVAAYADVSGALLAVNNLSDLNNVTSARTNLGVGIGTDVQAYSSVLANTTASFTTADETKLDGIEANATADQTAQEIATAIDADVTAEATLKTALGLGTAAYTASTDYATAAQGALADSALQSFTETNDLSSAVTWANVPDANITQSSVTQHQAALSVTESQISDLQSYLTAETNDLTAAVTWANVPDANITQSSVTQHQAALSITESQISDFGTYEPVDTDILRADTADTITVSMRGFITDNSASLTFDLTATNNFKAAVSTGTPALTFTGMASASGQSGNIYINNTGAVISAATSTVINGTDLTTISNVGKYWLSYYCDGTDVYVTSSTSLTDQGL